MRILYYTWGENSKNDITEALVRLGYEVLCCHIPFSDYEKDEEFIFNLEKIFIEKKCDCYLSFDFFPLIAKSAEHLKRTYISWIYDMPHWTLFSPSVCSRYVKLFVFDKKQYEQIAKRKKVGLFYMPLAVNTQRLQEQLGELKNDIQYKNEISFVGSLYEENIFRQINYLPEYLEGYLEGIIQAQQKVYGYNFVEEILDEKISAELDKYIKISLYDDYLVPRAFLYADMINTEITARDRRQLLAAVSDIGIVTLYSASAIPLDNSQTQIQHMGIIDYEKEMPKIFRHSKINLNITLRSIISGIPLRALDIMGAGGFLLSNYQEELAEYFVDGEDMVLFDSVEDLCWKIEYYLNHEEERKQIAKNGLEKVKSNFNYEMQLKEIMRLALPDE